MLSTGDVQGCLRQLEALLRVIKYPGYVDYNGLSKGDPSAFLPIVSFTLSSFSPPLAEQLTVTGLELTCKTDLRFIDTLYKVLRDIFHYKPILTKQQFLQWGFSQRKISVICDVINLVLQKHNQLMKASDGPFVVNHMENHPTFPTNTPHAEAFFSSSPGNVLTKRAGCWEDKDSFLDLPEVDERLSALEAQIKSLPGLHRLSILEKRIEELERQRHTDKNEEVITISRESWENLMNRVLLLETKLELSNTQSKAPAPCSSSASSYSSDSSKEDLMDRVERITNMRRCLKAAALVCQFSASGDSHRAKHLHLKD
ncbi:centrosomal protein of 44 kDa isoform X4 [Acanthopagrus latus]|uniref:centrosomal protein of 44 kDa isoform X4 n=1 Tax=Acanthopagrus latus TaxID=8177 RepID=UPI00187BEB11|nr:centrosomal protein of 44 kDa isoform X4 [Acanthopagrus latus]